jgi:hypothetical protein
MARKIRGSSILREDFSGPFRFAAPAVSARCVPHRSVLSQSSHAVHGATITGAFCRFGWSGRAQIADASRAPAGPGDGCSVSIPDKSRPRVRLTTRQWSDPLLCASSNDKDRGGWPGCHGNDNLVCRIPDSGFARCRHKRTPPPEAVAASVPHSVFATWGECPGGVFWSSLIFMRFSFYSCRHVPTHYIP